MMLTDSRTLHAIHTRHLRRSRGRRGYSLLEILVVLAIIGLLTAAVGFALFQHFTKARIETTRQNALRIRSAVVMFRMNYAGDECPTVPVLVKSQILDEASKQVDAWEHPFVVTCAEDGSIKVSSAGPDGRIGTEDDIVAPAPPPAPLPRAER